jgi:hypothetical protein
MPSTCQLTAVLAEPETVATKSCVVPAGTVARTGDTTTETGEGVGVGGGGGVGVGVGAGVGVGVGVGIGVGVAVGPPPVTPEPLLQPAKANATTEIRATTM